MSLLFTFIKQKVILKKYDFLVTLVDFYVNFNTNFCYTDLFPDPFHEADPDGAEMKRIRVDPDPQH